MERKLYKGYDRGMENLGTLPPVAAEHRRPGRGNHNGQAGVAREINVLSGLAAESGSKAALSCISDSPAFVRLPRLERGRYIMLRQEHLG